jgi:hypothetical protein
VEDIEIKSVLEYSLHLSKAHIQKLEALFTEEQLPIPEGFSEEKDLCEFYSESLHESIKLFNKATEVMLKKGTFIRSPYIPDYHKVEYVQKQSYFAGLWGDLRPLNVIDMTNLYFSLIQNQLGRSLLMGFSQVAKTPKVRDYSPQ